MVVLVQLDSEMLQVGGALRAKIHDDVEYRPTGASHELRLGSRRVLEVHPPQRALCDVEGDVPLGDDRIQAMLFELVLTEGPCEETPLVLQHLELDHKRSR
jgi:hypothetical protein